MCNRDSPFCTFLGATTRERQRQGACPEQGGERRRRIRDQPPDRQAGVQEDGGEACGEAGFERRPRRGTAPVTLVTWLPASSGALQKPA